MNLKKLSFSLTKNILLITFLIFNFENYIKSSICVLPLLPFFFYFSSFFPFRNRKKICPHSSVYIPNVHKSCTWARVNLGLRNSVHPMWMSGTQYPDAFLLLEFAVTWSQGQVLCTELKYSNMGIQCLDC